MRGDREQKCINKVRKRILNTDIKDFFGLTLEEINEITEAINKAKQNKNKSTFPDFVLKNGLIEHFRITSSVENSKGAKQIKKESLFNEKVTKEVERLKEEWENSNECGYAKNSWAMKYPEHSYEFLKNSIEKNFEKHMESFGKYQGCKKLSVFMIEYTDSALEMFEDVFEDWVDGMSDGDIRKPEHLKTYRLTRDKEMLNYIYKYKDCIKYVVYVYDDGCEIIKLESIPYLIKLIPWNYRIELSMGMTMISTLHRFKTYKK